MDETITDLWFVQIVLKMKSKKGWKNNLGRFYIEIKQLEVINEYAN